MQLRRRTFLALVLFMFAAPAQAHLAIVRQGIESADVPPNTVLQVLQTGYMLRDRMLRPARVVVSKAPEEKPPE